MSSAFRNAGIALLCAALSFAASAGPGHDHGDEGTPSASGRVLPRFTAESETFELVGILDGTRLTLFLDRYGDNSPVADASLEIDFGGVKLQPKPTAAGTFELVLAALPKPGVIAVTATVFAGKETDLLAGELDLHNAPAAAADVHKHGWSEYAAWIAAAVAAVLALTWLIRRRTRRPA